jgi:hypothetical protein
VGTLKHSMLREGKEEAQLSSLREFISVKTAICQKSAYLLCEHAEAMARLLAGVNPHSSKKSILGIPLRGCLTFVCGRLPAQRSCSPSNLLVGYVPSRSFARRFLPARSKRISWPGQDKYAETDLTAGFGATLGPQ